jgi:hypothetical protein
MLGVSSYPRSYVDACRASVDEALTTYRDLAKGAKKAALATFEPVFFGNMVLVLDASFVHRLRGKEGKDGNPLNEVRMLCTSLLQNNRKMTADKTVKYKPEQSVLKYEIGDTIALSDPDFARLADAFFAEIEKKYR